MAKETNQFKFKYSLLWQAASLITLLFGIAIIANGVMIYIGLFQIHRENICESMHDLVYYVRDTMMEYESLPWLLGYWREHASDMDLEVLNKGNDKEWLKKREEYLKDNGIKFVNDEKHVTIQEAEAMSEEEQRFLAESCYIKIQAMFDRLLNAYWPASLTASVRENEKENFVYFKGRVHEEDDAAYLRVIGTPKEYQSPYEEYAKLALGQIKQFDPATQRVYAETFKTGVGTDQIDVSHTHGVECYYMYAPINYDGDVLAVVSVAMSTNKVKSEFWKKSWMVEGVTVLVLVVVALLLLQQLSIIVLRPIRFLREHLHKYAQTQNSAMVLEELPKIPTHNEVGFVAQDIMELARRMDEFLDSIVRMTAEQERIGAELDVARKIQEGVLSKDFPENDACSVFASMHTAKEVGGDLYDFFATEGGRMAFVIADVSDKGVPAAMYMAITKTLIKNFLVAEERSLAEVVSLTNRRLCEGNEEMMFVTAWIGVWDKEDQKLVCVNAGHEKPFIRRGSGDFEKYNDDNGMPMGVMPDAAYEEYELILSSNDAVFIYTDGVCDAADSEGNRFGEDRMLAALNESPDDKPRVLLERMSMRVHEFTGNARQFDDITMLCVAIL